MLVGLPLTNPLWQLKATDLLVKKSALGVIAVYAVQQSSVRALQSSPPPHECAARGGGGGDAVFGGLGKEIHRQHAVAMRRPLMTMGAV